ncbi:hypothetical protein [Mesorhizobium sophorae]|uniref:hypothetical protein n=1 Tax=Mesorhizobium sophorae TaxID=1300294 RepID=UPI00117F338A|nr:hypothetical protein [Mesorhizobium sophorae]
MLTLARPPSSILSTGAVIVTSSPMPISAIFQAMNETLERGLLYLIGERHKTPKPQMAPGDDRWGSALGGPYHFESCVEPTPLVAVALILACAVIAQVLKRAGIGFHLLLPTRTVAGLAGAKAQATSRQRHNAGV